MSAPIAHLRPPRSTDVARGHELAIAMLEDFESDPDVTAARACLDPELRHLVGKHAYENVVLTKLKEARLQILRIDSHFDSASG